MKTRSQTKKENSEKEVEQKRVLIAAMEDKKAQLESELEDVEWQLWNLGECILYYEYDMDWEDTENEHSEEDVLHSAIILLEDKDEIKEHELDKEYLTRKIKQIDDYISMEQKGESFEIGSAEFQEYTEFCKKLLEGEEEEE